MKKYKIYCLKNPDTMKIRYIGVTTAKYLSSRLSQHYYTAIHDYQTHVAKWIRKIGKKPIIELIEIVDESVWEEREQYWISYYDNLTNTHKGGKGVVINREQSSIERSAKAHEIEIVQLTKEGEFIKKWTSAKEAVEHFGGKSRSSISNVLKERGVTAFGFQWFYYNNYISGNYTLRKCKPTINYNKLQTIYLYDMNDKLIKEFRCLNDVCKYFKRCHSYLTSCINEDKFINNKFYITNYKI